ncbi:general transcription factor IIE subunit 1 [Nilaparvata lugens]|uniref:general transcription factor IIE subunit 1 n=1 Tax=Nilaparvata lugens TaxID=108931 RepID=UPI00193E4129|nr:general transcription factor IIE subunit 1 [Nilaparvata lugens]
MSEEQLVKEVPSSLKQLARLVVRGFYTIEDALIIDMLVRNPCMKEDDICELLKFERKMLRARITTLRNDKFIQVRLRMETGPDGKAQKVNYYFINYKTFVNVVKYKLDLMRKRMETEERDATSRASFKCPRCSKTFTDLEADQLFDFATEEFRCTYCREVVEEDQSALPKKDSRLLLAKFNSQLEPLYVLLRQVEGIRLAPEVLEPDPVDISTIRGLDTNRGPMRPGGEHWSGEATRSQGGFAVEETKVDVTIGDDALAATDHAPRKERPLWMIESTVITNDQAQADPLVGASMEAEKSAVAVAGAAAKGGASGAADDIMSVLLAHERRGGGGSGGGGGAEATANAVKSALQSVNAASNNSGSEMSDDDFNEINNIGASSPEEIGDSEEDEMIPTVMVGGKHVPITKVDDALIKEMSVQEKEAYIQVYQEYYSNMLDC